MATAGGRTAKACVGSSLRLSCPRGSRIRISYAIAADSACYLWLGNCCEGSRDCKDPVGYSRMQELRWTCDGQTSCRTVAQKVTLSCYYSTTSEYEKITYDCVGSSIHDVSSVFTTCSLTANFRNILGTTFFILTLVFFIIFVVDFPVDYKIALSAI